MNRNRHRRIYRVEQLENRELLTETGSLTRIVDSPEIGTVKLASGDLDGDGDLDILLADGFAGWKENTGNGEFRFRSEIGHPTDRSDAVAPFDVDDDGDLDVLSAYQFLVEEDGDTRWNSEIGWHENVDGKGGFSAKRTIATVDSYVDRFDFVDIDADSDLDILYASRFDWISPGWLENENGVFSDSGLLVDHPTEFRFDMADIDGDARVDLAVREEHDGSFLWYRNTSDGWVLQEPLALHVGYSSWNFFDFDSDGDADYVDPSGIYLNDGDASYALEIPFDYKSDPKIGHFIFVPGATFEVVDVDSDGDPHVIYDGGSDGGASDVAGIIRNQDGKFINTPLARDIYFSVEFGDFTGDSKLDLLHRSHRSTDGNLFLFDAFEEKHRVSDRTGPADSVIAGC